VTVFIGYALLALIVAGLLFYGVVALLPDGPGLKPEADQRPFELPEDRRMVRADLDRVRIPVSLRGYRFAETDDLIDRLAAELVVRDEEIARLRSLPAAQERLDADFANREPAIAEQHVPVEPEHPAPEQREV
jgi:hypothetical protein